MCKNLPESSFRWLNDDKLQRFMKNGGEAILRLNEINGVGTGYVFEVHSAYPELLHDEHNKFPLCPEQIIVGEKSSVPKLMATLHRKTNYIVHYTYLKRALREGLILEKIHRGVKFIESPWLKPYMDANTSRWQATTDSFTKDLCKFMKNAVFGKSMENVRNR